MRDVISKHRGYRVQSPTKTPAAPKSLHEIEIKMPRGERARERDLEG